MRREQGVDARCKCRKCGAVAAAREWNATAGGAACPSCGHGHFSISFEQPRPRGPVPVLPGAARPVDEHGRHRRVVRREDFAAPTRPGAAFEQRLRERLGLPPDDEQ